MVYVLLGLALAFAVGAVVLVFLTRHFRARYAAMVGTETASVAELEERRKVAAGVVGGGFLAQIVEVKGEVECARPLQAELSGRECVLYRSRVTREYEEETESRDSEGRVRRETHRRSETVAENQQHAEFWVRDETGRILVDPAGAGLDLVKSVDRFEQRASEGAAITIGGVPVNLDFRLGGGTRTLGYRYTEEILPVGSRLFVLGEVNDASGQLTMRKPGQAKTPYIVSIKSEEELVTSARTWAAWMRIGYLVCFAAAAALLIALGVQLVR